MKDRDICERAHNSGGLEDLRHSKDILSDKWLREWSELYPVTTKTVVYQALVFAGEHEIAKEVTEECEYIYIYICCIF